MGLLAESPAMAAALDEEDALLDEPLLVLAGPGDAAGPEDAATPPAANAVLI